MRVNEAGNIKAIERNCIWKLTTLGINFQTALVSPDSNNIFRNTHKQDYRILKYTDYTGYPSLKKCVHTVFGQKIRKSVFIQHLVRKLDN